MIQNLKLDFSRILDHHCLRGSGVSCLRVAISAMFVISSRYVFGFAITLMLEYRLVIEVFCVYGWLFMEAGVQVCGKYMLDRILPLR